MELSELWIKKFEDEGFLSVYECSNSAGTVYPEHSHLGQVAIFVTDGSVTFDFSGEKKIVTALERINIPAGAIHSAVVGPQGWIGIVGEEILGDA